MMTPFYCQNAEQRLPDRPTCDVQCRSCYESEGRLKEATAPFDWYVHPPYKTDAGVSLLALADRLEASYDKVKLFPENNPTGYLDLLELRNLAPEIVAALRSAPARCDEPVTLPSEDQLLHMRSGLGSLFSPEEAFVLGWKTALRCAAPPSRLDADTGSSLTEALRTAYHYCHRTSMPIEAIKQIEAALALSPSSKGDHDER